MILRLASLKLEKKDMMYLLMCVWVQDVPELVQPFLPRLDNALRDISNFFNVSNNSGNTQDKVTISLDSEEVFSALGDVSSRCLSVGFEVVKEMTV
jgi:hypothetical protein